MYSVRRTWAQSISPQGDKGTCQLPNTPEEHPLEKKPERSYACLLSLFLSWDPSPEKGGFTHDRAGLSASPSCSNPPDPATPYPSYCSNLTPWPRAALFIPAHWVAEIHSHLCQWFGRLIMACLVSLSPPHPSTLSSTFSDAAGGVCPV